MARRPSSLQPEREPLHSFQRRSACLGCEVEGMPYLRCFGIVWVALVILRLIPTPRLSAMLFQQTPGHPRHGGFGVLGQQVQRVEVAQPGQGLGCGGPHNGVDIAGSLAHQG